VEQWRDAPRRRSGQACGRFFAVALASAAIGACSGSAAVPSEPAVADAAPSAEAPSSPHSTLTFVHDRPVVGADVRVTAGNLPPGKTVELMWETVTGGWVIEDYYHFRGKKYQPARSSLGRFPVDAQGRLDGHFTIPEDYGGNHEVLAVVDGKTVTQKGLEVTQAFEMTPLAGPVGTPIELKVTGLGYHLMDSVWVINWDNSLVGFVSAASSKGSAVARLRASGPSGSHVVNVLTGYQGQGYLNHEQAPNAYLPRPTFTFRTTPGRPASTEAYAEPYQRQPVPKTELPVANMSAVLSPTQGPVGTSAMLRGEGFTAGARVDIVWQTSVGSRVSGEGYGPSERSLGTMTVGGDGRIDSAIAIPDDLGGLHAIDLRSASSQGGETLLARVYFVTETSIVSISRTSGPVGTPVTIHLKGVGWTEYDNLYAATYDNTYMGYVCGFNSAGDVVINFKATGAPGLHIIDLYPGIYQGPTTEPQLLYLKPQLTYAEDHPGNKIPAIRFMFEITRAP
jgi:hypothetical protein